MYVCYGVAVDLGVIVGDGIFLYRVFDKLAAVTVYGQVRERVLPFAAFSKHRTVDLNVIGNKADSNAVGAFTVTVIIVIPYLDYCFVCFFNNVRVYNVVAVILRCVAFNGIFCDSVSDL